MIHKLKQFYEKDHLSFWTFLFISCLILGNFFTLLIIGTDYQLTKYYSKILKVFQYSWNILNDRNIFHIASNDEMLFASFPVYEIVPAFLSKLTSMDLYLAGRVVNFVMFLFIIRYFLKLKDILQSNILILILLYFLFVNQYFTLVLFTFHNEIQNYFLIIISLYFFYRNKLVTCYLTILLLTIIKFPYVVALVSFLLIEHFFNNNLYKENIIKVILSEKIKIFLLSLLLVLAIMVDLFRSYIENGNIFSISNEASINLFDIDIFKLIIKEKSAAFKYNNVYNLFDLKNLFFIFLPMLSIIKKDFKLLIKTILIYLLFFLNYFVFLKLYFHAYSFLGLAMVILIVLTINYKNIFNDYFSKLKLSKNKISILMLMFFLLFTIKIYFLNSYNVKENKDNKLISYAIMFNDNSQTTLVVNRYADSVLRFGFSKLERLHSLISSEEFQNNCEEIIKNYDMIFLLYDVSCATELILAKGNFYVDKVHERPLIFWKKNLDLSKNNYTDKIKINNFYDEPIEFNIEYAKRKFQDRIFFENNISIYKNEDQLFYVIKKCLSNNMVQRNIKLHIYYDKIGNLKLYNKKEFNKFLNYDFNIIANSMIENDTCYGKIKLLHSKQINKFEFGSYKFKE